MIESTPRRTPFPRVAPPSESPRPSAPVEGPSSSRLRSRPLAPSAGRAKDDEPTPKSGARPIERERILERYKRPAQPAEREDPSSARERKPVDDARAPREVERDKGAAEIKAKRDAHRAEQAQKLDRRRLQQAEARTKRLREEYAASPKPITPSAAAGSALSKANGYALCLGFGAGLGWWSPYGWHAARACWPWSYWDGCDDYWYGWRYGAYSYSWCTHPFAWTHRWWFGCWPRLAYWWPSYSARVYYSPPTYYASEVANEGSTDVVIYVDDEDDVVVEGGANVEVVRGGNAASAGAPGAAPSAKPATVDPAVAGVLDRGIDTLTRISTQYLADGDAAFREGRFGDAAHFYAKAIEFRPQEGVLYLVLSDALFATGDYHYGAFALRRALELDPTLAAEDFDKHGFYADPTVFDRQLATLERFLADHPNDGDARLLLAANYLFSRKAKAALELLEAAASESVRAEPAGKALLEAAHRSASKSS